MNNTIELVTCSRGIEYKVVNGTAYHKETPDAVVSILESARQSRARTRIFLGNTETGEDWMEEYDTIGTIGRSSGSIKIPLLIKSARSMGGGAVLDHCIVRITVDKRNVYTHPGYNYQELQILDLEEYAETETIENGLRFRVQSAHDVRAQFKTYEQARNYRDFLYGLRNSK